MSLFASASYALSVARKGEPLPASRGEVAFAGRSNAGKSSAINALAGQQRLAFVSKTPGRTQMINFFSLGADTYLVDLPGFGYARAPAAARERWSELVGWYLRERRALRGLVLVMDIRHPLTELDRQLIDFTRPLHLPLHVLLTKCDKVSRAQALKVLGSVERQLAEEAVHCSAQLFSSLRRVGLDAARRRLADLLGRDSALQHPVRSRERQKRKPIHTSGKMNPRAKGG
ncbi:MAG: YihA family ribosome biogenesis GTP-binding protein [Burkholderiales bacterium]|nr:YihA family ribosome biogenesis GTP-binding protein [Burkholderiales bacterium]